MHTSVCRLCTGELDLQAGLKYLVCWVLNSGLLQEYSVLLITEPTLDSQ